MESICFTLGCGPAWYKCGNFEKSARHYRAALLFSEDDPVALEYLYYSYLNLGKMAEARLLSGRFNQALKDKLAIKEGVNLFSLFAETGFYNNNSLEELAGGLPEGYFVSSYYLKNLQYLNGGANINLGNALQAKLAINRFSMNTIQQTIVDGEKTDFDHKGEQNGVYLNLNYQLKNGWSAGGAYHGIKGSYSASYYNTSSGGQEYFQSISDKFSQYYVGAYLARRIPYLSADIHVSQNSFWQGKYLQLGGEMAVYPLGNTDFYLTGGYDRLMSFAKDTAMTVVKGSLGFKMFSKIWIEGNIASGDMSNWADGSGMYVYNTPFPIHLKTGVNIYLIELIPRLSLTFSYSLQQREHQTEIYSITGGNSFVNQEYATSSIIGGISWRF